MRRQETTRMIHKPHSNKQELYISSCEKAGNGGGIYKYSLSDQGKLKYLAYLPCDQPMYAVSENERLHILLRAPFEESENSGYFSCKSDFSDRSQIQNTLGKVACHIAADRELQDAFRFTMSNGVKRLNLRKEVTKDQYDYHGITDLTSAFRETEYKQPHFEKEMQYNTLASRSKFCEISNEIFDKPEITSLNRFSNSTETLLYDINGLRVSKLKVLRIYDILCHNHLGNTLDALLYSICYNKIITEEEYRNLRKDIIQVTGWKGE